MTRYQRFQRICDRVNARHVAAFVRRTPFDLDAAVARLWRLAARQKHPARFARWMEAAFPYHFATGFLPLATN